MTKHQKNAKSLIDKVQKRKKEVRLRQEQRDTPIPYARVHETDKNNPKFERKKSKRIVKEVMHDYV